MEERSPAALTASRKRRFSHLLQNWRPLRLALSLVARLKAPRQPVGAVGVVFDADGRVLLVEHVFRTDYPWGLPGGWIEQGEEPRDAVRREIDEELGLQVEVGLLIMSEQVGLADRSTHPRHLGLAYRCRVISGTCAPTSEIVSIEWMEPDRIQHQLAPFQLRAIERAGAFTERPTSSGPAVQSGAEQP